MRVAVLFHRLGPYHHARLTVLSKAEDISSIEFTQNDRAYAWDVVSNRDVFPVVSLFKDDAIEAMPVEQILVKMHRALTSFRPMVVAIPGWSSPAALVALSWCISTRTPAVLMSDSTVNDEPRKWWKEWVKSRVVRLYSAGLVAGKPHVDYAVALGLIRSRVFEGYDVVDNDYFALNADKARSCAEAMRYKHNLPERYFLASNRFIEKKNLSGLLIAYSAYVSQAGVSAWSLVLLGDGPLKAELRAQVEHLGLSDRVFFVGFKQYDQLPIFYGLASVFIHASTSEQWGLVVNEAMASRLPVLVSNRCGCAQDLVKEGVNGFAFDPCDIEQMAACMLRISDGTSDLDAFGEASRSIIQTWSLEKFASSMTAAVDAALSVSLPRVGLIDKVLLWLLMRR